MNENKGDVYVESMKLFKYSRTSTLIFLKKSDETIWDIQPENFPNTIRWNAGHVYAEAEKFMHDAANDYEVTRPRWMDLFLDGTRPSEWEGDIPTKDEIIHALEEQTTRLETFFKDRMDQPADDVRDLHGTLLDTPDGALQFLLFHEGLHLGAMKSLVLAAK